MNKIELKRFCDNLSALYNKSFVNADELEVLQELYEPYTLKEMQTALKDYMRDKVYYPKPAELIRVADAHRKQYQQNIQQEAQKLIRYDSNGRQIFKCPYCQDSGWMLIEYGDNQRVAGHPCVCGHPIKSQELKQNGRVKITLFNERKQKFTKYYVFDAHKLMFVQEDRYEPFHQWIGDIDTNDIKKTTQMMLDQTELPF